MEAVSGIARLLSPDNLAFIQKGVSINVASRDVRRVPSLTRALSCRVDADGQRLRIALSRSQSSDLLRDIEKSGAIAVVFTEPSTHRTLQIKGADAGEVTADTADRACLEHTRAAFGAEIGKLGFDAAFNTRLFQLAPDDLVVLAFTPQTVFQQTPGPNAGALLEPAP
jgi:hypothetical protein